MRLTLLVLRTAIPAEVAAFYSILGAQFEQHKHGNSPLHYAGRLGDLLLEVYPLAKGQTAADPYVRLGFSVHQLPQKLADLAQAGYQASALVPSEFGLMALAVDPDGRKIELYPS